MLSLILIFNGRGDEMRLLQVVEDSEASRLDLAVERYFRCGIIITE